MTTIEDAVRDTLSARAHHAPVRLDGRQLLERVERQRRVATRVRVAAAAAAVAVLAGGASVWRAQTAVDPLVAVPATPTVSPGTPGLRPLTWDGLRFDVPPDWTVNETREVWPHPPGALLQGPFLGTLRTGPMCSTAPDGSGSCGRSNGILERRPTDGVVAWIDAGRVPAGSDETDPGDSASEVCPPGGTPFHAFRRLPTPEGVVRVVLDGCAYGPRTSVYLQQLRATADSLRPA